MLPDKPIPQIIDEFCEELVRQHGNLYNTYHTYSRETNFNYMDYWKLKQKYPELVRRVKEIRGVQGEWLESLLMANCAKGDNDAIKFLLRTQHGYSETQKVEVNANVEASTKISIEDTIKEMKMLLEDKDTSNE